MIDLERFDSANVDKVSRLLEFLDELANNPFAKERVCLHGGTALNLFVLEPARLSLDVDINYIGGAEKERMLKDMDPLVSAIRKVAQELGYRVESGKAEHAGTTMKLVYDRVRGPGGRDFIKVDLDFLNRVPLLPPVWREAEFDSRKAAFRVNAPIEVVAGKLTAISDRVVPRDLYDIGRIAETKSAWSTGDERLDRGVIAYYLGMAKSFPKQRKVLERFAGRDEDVKESLWPVLEQGEEPSLEELRRRAAPFIEWAATPQSQEEAEYLDKLSNGVFEPELLFADYPGALSAARQAPTMQWKLLNLRKALPHPAVPPSAPNARSSPKPDAKAVKASAAARSRRAGRASKRPPGRSV